jgi:signal transduction histidine kinase
MEVAQPLAHRCSVKLRLANSDSHEIQADPDRLRQVISNLLSNAIKFSPPDSEVVLSAERRGDTIRVLVRDHGPGIPLEFRSRIFHKFAQADMSDSRLKSGTGLGLSIVKEIVERLGGQVSFEDAPDRGSIFVIELPMTQGVKSATGQIAGHSEAA